MLANNGKGVAAVLNSRKDIEISILSRSLFLPTPYSHVSPPSSFSPHTTRCQLSANSNMALLNYVHYTTHRGMYSDCYSRHCLLQTNTDLSSRVRLLWEFPFSQASSNLLSNMRLASPLVSLGE